MIISLRCQCRAVGGTLEVASGLRIVCYCDDCQAYARALARPDVLNAAGGTDVWQTVPARLKLTEGLEHLRCLRLSDKGMLRWHTGCCSTPIGNTMTSSRVPFVGVMHAIMDLPAQRRDDLLGKPAGVQGRFAIGGVPAGTRPMVSPRVLGRSLALLTRGFLTRAQQPTPFFDAAGAPAVEARVLSVAARAALRLQAS